MGSFESFYGEHRDRLVAVLFGFVGDMTVAADAVDEAFTKAYTRWNRISRHPEPAGWVFVTARNEARRQMKRRTARPAFATKTTIVGPAGETWLLVAALPDRQREAVALRHLLGLTEQGVAEAMGITRGTVSSTLRDAYRSLGLSLADSPPIENIEARP
ncbi:MAG: sigma factor-like helix-turn-helix DNA-binding protein [Acidimicrobiales bacterium]